jgi:hypothetical protein
MISHGDDFRGGGWFNDMGNQRMHQILQSCIKDNLLLQRLEALEPSDDVREWIESIRTANIEHDGDVIEQFHFMSVSITAD